MIHVRTTLHIYHDAAILEPRDFVTSYLHDYGTYNVFKS